MTARLQFRGRWSQDTKKTKAPRRSIWPRLVGLIHARQVNVAFLTGASLIQLTLNAAAALAATTVLGPAQRGTMVLGLTIGSIMAMIGGMGTGAALRSRLPLCSDLDTRKCLTSSYTWWSGVAMAIGTVTATGVSALSALAIDPALSSTPFLIAVGAYTASQVLLVQTSEAWFADAQYRRGGTAGAAITAGGLAALLAVISFTDSATITLLAQGGGSAAVWTGQIKALRKAGLLTLARPRFADVRSLVARGAPALGLTLGLAMVLRADRYILGATAGTAAVGIYSLAATLSEIPRMLPQSVGQMFLRDVAVGHERQRPASWILLPTLATIVPGAVIAGLGSLLIVPVFGGQFAEAQSVLLILVVAEVGFAPYSVASRGLLGGGWTRTTGLFGLVACVGAIVCYVIASAMGGSLGLAVGCIVLYTALSVASSVLLYRRIRSTPSVLTPRGPVATTAVADRQPGEAVETATRNTCGGG